jgi:hypothetical protein
METSLSKKGTLYMKDFKHCRRTLSGLQFGNPNSGLKSQLPLAPKKQDFNLGQSLEKRLHWPLDLPSLSSTSRNYGAPPKQLHHQ